MGDLHAVPRRTVGGYEQSRLILGTAQLGGPYGVANTSGVPAAKPLLDRARELGITHVDTARAYGHSESRIGAALAGAPGPALRIVTKVEPIDWTAHHDPDTVAQAVGQSVRASRASLAVDQPVTVLLHRAHDAIRADGAAWSALRAFVEDGTVDRIGVSVQSPAELEAVATLPDLGYVQLPFNVLDRRWIGLDVLDDLGGTVVLTARSVYLQGLLTAGRELTWPVVSPSERDGIVEFLDKAVETFGRESRADLCTAYALSWPWMTSIVVGVETVDQLERNAALAGRPPLRADERDRLAAEVPTVPGDLVDPSTWNR